MGTHKHGCFRGVAVITCASHAQGPRFDPGRKHHFFFFPLLHFLFFFFLRPSLFFPCLQRLLFFNLDRFSSFYNFKKCKRIFKVKKLPGRKRLRVLQLQHTYLPTFHSHHLIKKKVNLNIFQLASLAMCELTIIREREDAN